MNMIIQCNKRGQRDHLGAVGDDFPLCATALCSRPKIGDHVERGRVSGIVRGSLQFWSAKTRLARAGPTHDWAINCNA